MSRQAKYVRLVPAAAPPRAGKPRAGPVRVSASDVAASLSADTPATPLVELIDAATSTVPVGYTGYLLPEDTAAALDLAASAVDTGGAEPAVLWAWLAEMITDPVWGIIQWREATEIWQVVGVLRRLAAGEDDAPTDRQAAADAAHMLAAENGYPPELMVPALAAAAAADPAQRDTYAGDAADYLVESHAARARDGLAVAAHYVARWRELSAQPAALPIDDTALAAAINTIETIEEVE